ncbi:hypothetical protein LQ327_20910 [Actinomycetospora endophytica]|uniref:Uncharacterized protein n=1 Tax=Actinomycetospora endophytica TaxID=2291215 RepID=A0ABS8PC59_9PSEU|nr:hypothetical protein [Actinomycetospora endophytica]MCD2195837.1 hypothetical protein [Actinomycetospora endophytica]
MIGRVVAAVAIFALAMLLVTGVEMLLGHPVSGGAAAHLTVVDLFSSHS